MEIYKYNVIQFLDFMSSKAVIWENQRGINMDWVQELKKQQYEYLKVKGRNPIIPGSIVLVNYQDTNCLIDGQHRYQMILEMLREGVDFTNTYISVEIYKCFDDNEKAYSIYNMVNSRYGANGIIKDDGAKYIIEYLTKKFPLQSQDSEKSNAPYFSTRHLERAIKDSDILRYKSVEEIIQAILDANLLHGNELYISQKSNSKNHYERCYKLGGFFLPYKKANCSWFLELSKQLK